MEGKGDIRLKFPKITFLCIATSILEKNKQGCLLHDHDRRRDHLCKIRRPPKRDQSIILC